MKKYAGEFLILVSIVATSIGAWMIYEPAGVITAAVLSGALGVMLLPLGKG